MIAKLETTLRPHHKTRIKHKITHTIGTTDNNVITTLERTAADCGMYVCVRPWFYQLNVPALWGHNRDLQMENHCPRRSLGLGAVVTNEWCIRRCRVQPNNVVSDNISDEQPPQMNILNIITCCICNNRCATNG